MGRRWKAGGCGRKRATQGALVVTGVLSPSLWQLCGPTRVTTLVHAHTHRLESDCGVCPGHCIVFLQNVTEGGPVKGPQDLCFTSDTCTRTCRFLRQPRQRACPACRAKPRSCPSSHTRAWPSAAGPWERVGLRLRRLEFEEGGREGGGGAAAECSEAADNSRKSLSASCRGQFGRGGTAAFIPRLRKPQPRETPALCGAEFAAGAHTLVWERAGR